MLLVDYGESVIGYTKKQMTMLVSILGLGQFFGQLMFGLLANYSGIDEMILYNIGAVFCGLASLLIPYVAYSYGALVTAILIFGLAVSANYALTSIILANMCGLELLTSAYGLILLGQGLSSLGGPVLGGEVNPQSVVASLTCDGVCSRLDRRTLRIQNIADRGRCVYRRFWSGDDAHPSRSTTASSKRSGQWRRTESCERFPAEVRYFDLLRHIRQSLRCSALNIAASPILCK